MCSVGNLPLSSAEPLVLVLSRRWSVRVFFPLASRHRLFLHSTKFLLIRGLLLTPVLNLSLFLSSLSAQTCIVLVRYPRLHFFPILFKFLSSFELPFREYYFIVCFSCASNPPLQKTFPSSDHQINRVFFSPCPLGS